MVCGAHVRGSNYTTLAYSGKVSTIKQFRFVGRIFGLSFYLVKSVLKNKRIITNSDKKVFVN